MDSIEVSLRCPLCGRVFRLSPKLFTCPFCGVPLDVVVRFRDSIDWGLLRSRPLSVWRYRELLPLPRGAEVVTLGEGGTPLVRASKLPVNVRNLYIKFEGANPTGSFKDRGMTFAVSLAKYLGVESVIVASTGNTSASAAAYAARAGLRCYVVLPKGKVARGKVSQAVLHGAKIVEVEGSFDNALEVVMRVVRESAKFYPLNSFNPWRLEGQKTVAYEIYDQLGEVPDVVVVPVGNAGNISAIWKGFKELKELGVIDKLPRMIGVQASGAAPLVKAWVKGLDRPEFVERPETVATAIRIGRPVNWPKALRAVRESSGGLIDVSDDEIINAYKLLARLEGLGAEPAGAASIAGILKLTGEGLIDRDEVTVAIVTGHTLKDPDTAISLVDYDLIRASSINDAVSMLLRG